MFKRKKNEKSEKSSSLRELDKSFVCIMNGPFELNIENYGSLGDYNEKRVFLMFKRKKREKSEKPLSVDYFTDIDMKITGRIRLIRF